MTNHYHPDDFKPLEEVKQNKSGIENHEWFDICQPKVLCKNELSVSLDTNQHKWLALGKMDAIALAKHFNLTPKDLI